MAAAYQPVEPVPKLSWSRHPAFKLPTAETLRHVLSTLGKEAGGKKILEVWKLREEAIRLANEDPLNYGYEPEPWKKVRELIAQGFDEIFILGGNREGKTEMCAKIAMEDLATRKCEWAFFHNTDKTSINQQQSRLFHFLPPVWRDAAQKGNGLRDGTVKIRYTVSDGFSGSMFILPQTHSIGYFWNYLQRMEVWEGPEYDGMWFDERVTLAILETCRYRLGKDRRLIRLISFTPKWGFSPVIQNAIGGAQIVETRPALLLKQNEVHVKGCPKGHLPYVMHGKNPKSALVFFHNQMNVCGAGKEIAQTLIGAPKERVMIRGYGWATRSERTAFPRWSEANLVTRERFNQIADKGVARYCSADPGGSDKSWFIKWLAVTPEGWVIEYREWPDFQHYEEWARSPAELDEDQEQTTGRKYDWRPGPAQRTEKGLGMTELRRRILYMEGWTYDEQTRKWDGSKAEQIERRLIDPRMGGMAAPSQNEEGNSIIDLMATPILEKDGTEIVPPMYWEPAPASQVHETCEMLEDAMAWDMEKPLGPGNCPKWYIVDDLLQSKLAYQEFTGLGTLKDALKDCVDPARYFIKSGYGYVDAEKMKVKRQTYY